MDPITRRSDSYDPLTWPEASQVEPVADPRRRRASKLLVLASVLLLLGGGLASWLTRVPSSAEAGTARQG